MSRIKEEASKANRPTTRSLTKSKKTEHGSPDIGSISRENSYYDSYITQNSEDIKYSLKRKSRLQYKKVFRISEITETNVRIGIKYFSEEPDGENLSIEDENRKKRKIFQRNSSMFDFHAFWKEEKLLMEKEENLAFYEDLRALKLWKAYEKKFQDVKDDMRKKRSTNDTDAPVLIPAEIEHFYSKMFETVKFKSEILDIFQFEVDSIKKVINENIRIDSLSKRRDAFSNVLNIFTKDFTDMDKYHEEFKDVIEEQLQKNFSTSYDSDEHQAQLLNEIFIYDHGDEVESYNFDFLPEELKDIDVLTHKKIKSQEISQLDSEISVMKTKLESLRSMLQQPKSSNLISAPATYPVDIVYSNIINGQDSSNSQRCLTKTTESLTDTKVPINPSILAHNPPNEIQTDSGEIPIPESDLSVINSEISSE